MTALVAKRPATEALIEIPGDAEQFMKLLARGIFICGARALQQLAGGLPPPVPPPEAAPTEVMTADEVAAFLGVDRNTVYDYAGRGVIPHQRLGKRILFRRAALLSWLDSCKATSTRKG